MSAPTLSVIVPCYNEQESIQACHERLTEVLRQLNETYEIVYVDDGSSDTTAQLLEEIHAVAPGAKLVYCEPTTFVDFTSCLSQFATAGATVVLDDIGFASDGVLNLANDQTSALNQFLTANPSVMMFTSAGNNDGTYWEGTYSATPVSMASPALPTLACPSGSGICTVWPW